MAFYGAQFRKMASAVVALLAVSALSACDVFMAYYPARAEPFDPPAQYQLWWQQVEACSGLTSNFDRVDWWIEPGVSTISGRDGAAGIYQTDRHSILLAGDWADDGRLVRHEMLHAFAPNVDGHPRELFLHRCGDVVSCGSKCFEGPPAVRGPEIARIPESALAIEAWVEPTTPTTGIFDGHFVIVVTARNPYNHDAVVELVDNGLPGEPRGFGFLIEGHPTGNAAWYNGFLYDDGFTYFRANETKRAVFDFRVGNSAGRLPPGQYLVIGYLNYRQSDTTFVTLMP